MARALAYLLTWTTYGTWLHGDQRGSVDRHNASRHMEFHPPNPVWERTSRRRIRRPVVRLSKDQRHTVRRAVAEHCLYKNWRLFAANCRTNHVHVVVAADKVPPERVMTEMKAYATRALGNDGMESVKRIWTRGGSTRYLNGHASIRAAIRYVLDQ